VDELRLGSFDKELLVGSLLFFQQIVCILGQQFF
jgi:hypothetical protein